eukprot:5039706-Alexandrium_andersonii.AAC.1
MSTAASRSLTWQHIHAHCSHPWNELADALADLAQGGCKTGGELHTTSPHACHFQKVGHGKA